MPSPLASPHPALLQAQASALSAGKGTGSQSQADFRAAARKTANEFEAVFLNTYLESMFSGVNTDGPFGGGESEKTYRSMLLGEYSKSIAASGGLGIADHIYRELLALQELKQ
ncbi:MAG: hypothetical protein D6773_05110 [Alphaproteobacteria bacterium]|nr:MAG: hypothetical protein D6773_05110 [Alphaproteobacteria bacterium]